MSGQQRDEIPATLHDLAERVQELERRAGNERRRVGAHDRDLARIGPQVAALEERVEALRERVEPAPHATAADEDRARSLLAEVRRDHAQVRMRVTTLVKYEERIEQLEAALRTLGASGAQPEPKN